MKRFSVVITLLWITLGCITMQAQRATFRMDAGQRHQRITGFGGFVCSPQFTYNHMSTTDINKVWGKGSTVGCNIMRLYIPIGRSAWSQSLLTAKNAKQRGLIVFASPWGQPAEWKTNGTINAKNSDGTTGSLKREYWADYAKYLEDYVQYLRQNGVELDAISIQNEPDWPAQYAGCLWSASEIAEFVRTYGKSISCKVMAPETLAVSDSYANALNKSDVIDCFDIYGGHQYGGIQSAYKQLGKKGKELWMTEYLINWNEIENNTRNFDFTKDFFDFFRAINTCMLGDFNAWIHYAAKRYYAMLGDGQRGTDNGVVTKRGYVMAHFAHFVTGMTRIDGTFSGSALEGSAYLSASGDTAVAVVANNSDAAVELTADLPFYTSAGELYTTGKSANFTKQTLTPQGETCRPTATIAAQSVATLLFVRSHDRQPSNMQCKLQRFDRLDDMTATKTTFGTTYKMSGTTRKFDHNTPLISARTNAAYGYVALDDSYQQLVMHVNSVSSTLNYTSSITTLTYVNAQGQVATHDYGTIDYNRRENFDLVFDLSEATLKDGCRGLISMTCNNWSSTLTINFGDVYLTRGTSLFAATLSGAYVADDSNILDVSSAPGCTSIDMTKVTELPSTLPWLSGNKIVYAAADSPLTGDNVVKDGQCASLAVNEAAGTFRPAKAFTAATAAYTCMVSGQHIVTLPFEASVPSGARVYTLSNDLQPEEVTTAPAGRPLLVVAAGEVTFTGSGSVSYYPPQLNDAVLPISGVNMPDIELSAPTFSQPHGLYDGGTLTVAISGTPGVAIRYTTDGSEPTATSQLYTAPLTIDKTTVLRAAEVYGGKLSPVATASYIFVGSVLSQPDAPEGYPAEWGKYTQIGGTAKADYGMDPEMTTDATLRQKIIDGLKSLPILNIVTAPGNLFSHENDADRGGIYIFTGPPVGDNTGNGWTRRASVELFGGPQQHDMSAPCGVRLHGGHGRLAEKNPKHSLRVVFKTEYGQKSLKYPLFGDGSPKKIDQFVLRCHFGNSWQHWDEGNRQKTQYSRDVWARKMQEHISGWGVKAAYVHLFLNGMYWGLYNIAERVDDKFGEAYLGGDKDDIDVVKIEEEGGNHLEAADGNLDAWHLMTETVNRAASSNAATAQTAYEQLDTLLNIGQFIDYMLINQYSGNTDWAHHNWYAIRRRNAGEGFKFLCWDTELIFDNVNENNLKKDDGLDSPTGIFTRLIKNGQFARQYMNRAKELLSDNGMLGPKAVVAVWDSLYNTISTAIYTEAARWGDYRRDVHPYQSRGQLYTVDNQFMAERRRLLDSYFPQRTSRVLSDINSLIGPVGISEVQAVQPATNGRYYNLQGQAVDRRTKGVYILNGKKVVIR